MKNKYIYSKKDLISIFKKIGITKGMNLILHSSLGSLGYVVNGPNDIIDALLEIIGKNGTLMMPAHTGDKTDPADWKDPPVPREWVNKIRKFMSPFDPLTTPIRRRGIIPEVFLLYNGVYRSNHPIASIVAKGGMARQFTKIHPLHQSEGIDSPVGKLYRKNGFVLLLGVDLSANTSIHLAEYLADVPYLKKTNVKVIIPKKGENRFVKLRRYPASSFSFVHIEKDLIQNNLIKINKINNTAIRFMKLRPVIDFIVQRLTIDPYYLIKYK